jgi:hypothetical protein
VRRSYLLVSHETGVEGAGEGDVCGALDEGATVCEEGEGVGAAAKLEQKPVLTDFAVGAKALGGGGEIDGAVVLVDLDRIAAAEGDVRTSFATQMGEIAALADLAAGTGMGGGDLGALVLP